jgi:hypothetical protein
MADNPNAQDVAAGNAATGNVVVVVVPGDAAHAGQVVRAITDSGTRAAMFLGDPSLEEDRSALLELIDELFGRD